MRKDLAEHRVEKVLVSEIEARGGYVIKLAPLGRVGLPDRLVLLPGGVAAFVELKAPGKPLRPAQARWISRLHALGFFAYVIDHPDQASALAGKLAPAETPP